MGSDMYMNPPPEDPPLPLSKQIQMLEDKLKLMEGENEDLHAKLNARTNEVESLKNVISVLRTHDTLDPAATVQLVDFWRNQISRTEFAVTEQGQEVENQMTTFVQETARLLQDQVKPRPGVQCYLDEKAWEYRRQLSVLAEQLDDWMKNGGFTEDFKEVCDDIRKTIGEPV